MGFSKKRVLQIIWTVLLLQFICILYITVNDLKEFDVLYGFSVWSGLIVVGLCVYNIWFNKNDS